MVALTHKTESTEHGMNSLIMAATEDKHIRVAGTPCPLPPQIPRMRGTLMVLSSQPLSTSQFLTICSCTQILSSVWQCKTTCKKCAMPTSQNHMKHCFPSVPLRAVLQMAHCNADVVTLLTATASRNLGET